MRPIPKILFMALMALCWSSLASADPQNQGQSLDSSQFAAVTSLQLDMAFERFATLGSKPGFQGLMGPTTMDCSSDAIQAGLETCVVTSSGPSLSMPAALAQH